VRIDAWVTPPAYTGRAPVYLTGDRHGTGADPHSANSNLTVRVSGGKADEKVVFRRKTATALEIAAEDSKTQPAATARTAEGGQPRPPIRQHPSDEAQENGALWSTAETWAFDVIPTRRRRSPSTALPKPTVNGALEIGFTAKDDYGVQEACRDRSRRQADPTRRRSIRLPEYRLDLPSRNARDAKGLTSRT
jgi:hypothetical protein